MSKMTDEENSRIIKKVLEQLGSDDLNLNKVCAWSVIQTLKLLESQQKPLTDEEIHEIIVKAIGTNKALLYQPCTIDDLENIVKEALNYQPPQNVDLEELWNAAREINWRNPDVCFIYDDLTEYLKTKER